MFKEVLWQQLSNSILPLGCGWWLGCGASGDWVGVQVVVWLECGWWLGWGAGGGWVAGFFETRDSVTSPAIILFKN